MTQKQAILNHLKKNKNGITSIEAIERFGATRLSGIIWSLRHDDGYNISSKLEKVKSRFGTTHVSRYKLEG